MLTKAQRRVLERLAAGDVLRYIIYTSTHSGVGYFWQGTMEHVHVNTANGLVQKRLAEHYDRRVSGAKVRITAAGRAALEEA